ncbi:MAG: DNA primase family protein [Acidimicrobiales bacterium]
MTSAGAPHTTPGAEVLAFPASGYFDGARLATQRLGQIIEDEGHLRMGEDSRLWRYDHGVYRPDGETFVRARVRDLVGERVRASHFTEVLTWCRARYPTISDQVPEGVINVTNGLVDWRTGQLLRHDPAVLSTIQLPHPWLPAATCPAIDAFLHQILADDVVELVYEICGYALYPSNPMRKAILEVGRGANGKSKLLAVIRALVGPANCSAVDLQALSENRFAPAELYMKLVNISGDLDARAVKRSDSFKKLTGGDPLEAERKNGQPFRFIPTALPLFAANEPPISSDQSQAWFDRWLIIPFDRTFSAAEADSHLEAKITTPAELQGLLVKAVAGLRQLMNRGRFDLPPAVIDAGDRYRMRLDTVRAFVDEECALGETWVPRKALYDTYRQWCTGGGRLALAAVTFYDHLRANFTLEERTRNGTRGFAGIGLLAADPHQQPDQ